MSRYEQNWQSSRVRRSGLVRREPLPFPGPSQRSPAILGPRLPPGKNWQREECATFKSQPSDLRPPYYLHDKQPPADRTISCPQDCHRTSLEPHPSSAPPRLRRTEEQAQPAYPPRSAGFHGDSDFNILFFGSTGVGKSAFISHLINSGDGTGFPQRAPVGHSLASCTKEVAAYRSVVRGRAFTFIDTPGFDDTHRSDVEILKIIADYLARHFRSGRQIHGLIFLHPITDVRLSASAIRLADIAKRLCGRRFFGQVALVTNMWQLLPGTEAREAGRRRATELLRHPKFWAAFDDNGASRYPFYNTRESAEKIVEGLARRVSNMDQVSPLKIQMEMVSKDRPLSKTAAGDFLEGELLRRKQQHQMEIHRIQNEIRQAREERDFDSSELLSRSLDAKRFEIRKDERELNGF